ncbi:MAG: glucodextranase DOMON-like domain-containing protein [Myxococcota bacterium]
MNGELQTGEPYSSIKSRCVVCFSAATVWLLSACSGGQAGGTAPNAGATDSRPDNGMVTLIDPKGDDNGPGGYVYPTDQVYKDGSFDLVRLEVEPKGDRIEFRVELARRVEDPWDSKAWGGNGFSTQMAFIHIDTDHVAGSGVTVGMPGTNVRFADEEAWDRVVIVSPQGRPRIASEVDAKAAEHADRVVVPRVTRASGKTLIAIVDVADLGGVPAPGWGYQVLIQSNEGFPAKTDLLTRKVNEYEGQHRFGGGTDYDNDPHVIDMLVAPAQGGADEVAGQHTALDAFNKSATEPSAEDLAQVPMVYPGS